MSTTSSSLALGPYYPRGHAIDALDRLNAQTDATPGEAPPSEVVVRATHGGPLQRAACILGLHLVRELPSPARGGPRSIRFCWWCGESDDPRWVWRYTLHLPQTDETVSLVHYRTVEP